MEQYLHNPGPNVMYVRGTMIPPGEGKLVEVPRKAAAIEEVDAGPSLDELVNELLDKPVTAIVPLLPQLTNEALDRAEQLEVADGGKKRKTLVDAIGAERIRRADEKLQQEQEQEAARALQAARDDYDAAIRELEQLPPDAPEGDRAAAAALVDETSAKVAALTPKE